MANPLSVSSFIVALFLGVALLMTKTHSQQPTTLSIDANSAPGSNTSLQYHVCGLGSRELVSDTILQLSGGVHHLEEGPFCLLQNLENFRIQGQQSQPRNVIYCQSDTETRRGIAFFNISSLRLSHLVIINCGREVPSGLPGHVNNTFTYLGPLQKAVMIITHSTDVILENISIDKCFGFGLLFINPLGNAVFRQLSVTGTTSLGLTECPSNYVGERSDAFCSGSGVVVVFYDTYITGQLVEVRDNYTTSLLIHDCSFVNNSNWMPLISVQELHNALLVAYDTERILMTGGLSLAVYMGQRDYFVDVKISDTSSLSNTGNIPNIFVMQYNTIHMSKTLLENVTVSDNTAGSGMQRGAGLMFVVIAFVDSLNTFRQSRNEIIYDLLEINHSNFTHNIAYAGGALMLYMIQQNTANVRVLIRDTIFTNNRANIGSALYAFQFPSLINSRGTYIYMEDVTASGNTFPQIISDNSEVNTLENPADDSGVFIASQCLNITLVGTDGKGCHFSKNNVSVFTAVRTNMILRGSITFEDNHG